MKKPETSSIEQYVIDAIRRKRKEKGISQRDLAYRLDISVSFIGEVESGLQVDNKHQFWTIRTPEGSHISQNQPL